jgi:hypothetical protein
LNVASAANAGANPQGVHYSVVCQLGPGEVRTEYWVDNSIAAVGAGNYLPTAGGAMTGPLTLSGNPPTQYAPNVTQLVGSNSDGAACNITSDPSLDFFPQYVPPLNQLIVASYRGSGRAVAQVENEANVVTLENGSDDGTRGAVRVTKTPRARTDVDCENAALAMLDDAVGTAWSGSYATGSDFLTGAAEDIFPGDAITVNVPSRRASFTVIVRAVEIEIATPAGDRSFYIIGFANDLASLLAIEYVSTASTIPLQNMPPLLQTTQVGAYYQLNLTEARRSRL